MKPVLQSTTKRSGAKRAAESAFTLFVNHGRGVNLLNIIKRFKRIEQLLHFYRILAFKLGFVLRFHRHFAEFRLEAGLFQRFLDGGKIVGRRDDFNRAVLVVQYVFGTGFDGSIHQSGFVGAWGEQHLATMGEQKGDAAVGAHVAAVFGEGMAYISHGANLVVGEAVHHDGCAVDAVALVANFLVIDAFELAGSAFDGVVDVVLGQALRLCLFNGQPQSRVGANVAAAHLGRDRDFLDQFGEHLAPLGVLASFSMLDIGPF